MDPPYRLVETSIVRLYTPKLKKRPRAKSHAGANVMTALITGASSGIGRAFAHLFAKDGHAVVLVARRRAVLDELAAELTRTYRVSVQVIPCDLTNAEAPSQLHATLQRSGIVVDVLVNNAGFGMQGAFAELSLDR
jgi:uncharacterized protein